MGIVLALAVRLGISVISEHIGLAASVPNSQLALANIVMNAEPSGTASGAQFIESGLRAARASRSTRRASILVDLATVLGCAAHELEFMFHSQSSASNAVLNAANDSDPVIMPSYADALRLGQIDEPLAAE